MKSLLPYAELKILTCPRYLCVLNRPLNGPCPLWDTRKSPRAAQAGGKHYLSLITSVLNKGKTFVGQFCGDGIAPFRRLLTWVEGWLKDGLAVN